MYYKSVFIITIIIAVITILYCVFGVRCREGYIRTSLANTCRFNRSPVDYAFKNPCGWQRNPHWQANPGDEHQPLEYGPIDFYPDSRRMDNNDGVLFQQYSNDWRGMVDQVLLINDEKGRFDLENVGDHGARVIMDDLNHPRFAPYPVAEVELDHVVQDCGERIYGGKDYIHDAFGD